MALCGSRRRSWPQRGGQGSLLVYRVCPITQYQSVNDYYYFLNKLFTKDHHPLLRIGIDPRDVVLTT